MLVHPGVCIFCGAPIVFVGSLQKPSLRLPSLHLLHQLPAVQNQVLDLQEKKPTAVETKSRKGISTPLGGHGWDLMIFIFAIF